MTEQGESTKELEETVRMYSLLRDAQDGLEYVFMEEPAGLTEDEGLAESLERLLERLEQWTGLLRESKERSARAQSVGHMLLSVSGGNSIILQDEAVMSAILLLEQRLPEAEVPF